MRVLGGLIGGQFRSLRRAARPFPSLCVERGQVVAEDRVVAPHLLGRQMPATDMTPEGLPADTQLLGSLGDQHEVLHVVKITELLTTVKAYHGCNDSGPMVQCNRGKHFTTEGNSVPDWWISDDEHEATDAYIANLIARCDAALAQMATGRAAQEAAS